jgi:hypothetical protein
MTTAQIDQTVQTATDEYAPPPPVEKNYFGQISIVDSYDCILEKGRGKILFDPKHHEEWRKKKMVKISVSIAKREGGFYTIDQEKTTDSKEWRMTYASLQRLKLMVPGLAGKYVQIKRSPTGDTWTNDSGESNQRTAMVFVAVFPDEAAMQAAQDAFYKRTGSDSSTSGPSSAPSYSAPAAATAQAAPPTVDRSVAANFLPAMWTAAAQDKAKFYDLVRTNEILAPHFGDPTVPEMVAYLGEDFLPF